MLEQAVQISQIVTGVVAIFIAGLGVRLTMRQNDSAWLRNLNELHQLYWRDDDFEYVRSWLASDGQYPELEQALRLRFVRSPELTADHYSCLERLDKFFNFLIRVKIVDKKYKSEEDLWDGLFFKFWLEAIVERERWCVLLYFQVFYGGTRIAPDLDLGSPSFLPDDESKKKLAAKAVAELGSEYPEFLKEKSLVS